MCKNNLCTNPLNTPQFRTTDRFEAEEGWDGRQGWTRTGVDAFADIVAEGYASCQALEIGLSLGGLVVVSEGRTMVLRGHIDAGEREYARQPIGSFGVENTCKGPLPPPIPCANSGSLQIALDLPQ